MLNSRHSIPSDLNTRIERLGKQLGFDAIGFSAIDLGATETRLLEWLRLGYQGDMAWMAKHGSKRTRPAELVPNTLSIISVRMSYLPPEGLDPIDVLNHPNLAYISRYALGRDYHKVLKQRLEKLAQGIQQWVGEFGYRVFTDSAPVMEKPIAINAGLGWMGKHTNVLNRETGSWFFLGEIYTDLPLAPSHMVAEHCGRCTACIDICPTQAIIAPYVLNARRCISYLTIEHAGIIPEIFRKAIGNRIYGCDDCQLVCPWNRFAQTSTETDFAIRHQLDRRTLVELFLWSEKQFNDYLAGSAIRRIGHERWQRNLAIALGNAPTQPIVIQALTQVYGTTTSALVRTHIEWALEQHKNTNNCTDDH
ncbi:tRNA epoxyqueuosine(34) reductase QueG [Thiofilum flexile]|uniref:tRNA epoxyqueuosine(34) reductase QueG n=1 Tax=Thiofilum flexile TaxID=125627 RepID=UPI00036F9393|nr:tRNA epoxyqueuosine(34) reductase QueG [Thiofilum flexile]